MYIELMSKETKPSNRIIPYYTQRSVDFLQDGYPDKQTAAHWQERSCGVACVRMVIAACNNGVAPNAWYIIQRLLERGAYLPGKGWIHKELADYLSEEYGIASRRLRIESVRELQSLLQEEIVIASVGVCFANQQRSGHLVLIYDSQERDTDFGFILHHPSSCADYEWRAHFVPSGHFERHFSGNLIVCRHSNTVASASNSPRKLAP